MNTMDKNQMDIERKLYEELRHSGLIPQTEDEVARARAMQDFSMVDMPEQLREASKVFERIQARQEQANQPASFGHFVAMMRTQKRYSITKLAAKARVDAEEIERIENEPGYEPKPRTVRQLAEVFGVAVKGLGRLAGLTSQPDPRIVKHVVPFAACAKDWSELTHKQRKLVKDFITFLNSLE